MCLQPVACAGADGPSPPAPDRLVPLRAAACPLLEHGRGEKEGIMKIKTGVKSGFNPQPDPPG
jgi:hypothetical protein